MGGRGSSSGFGGGNPNSTEYKEHYAIEMEGAQNFEASFVLNENLTNDSIGYEMMVYQSVRGESLIARTNSDIAALKRDLKESNAFYREALGMSSDAIGGMKKGIRERIAIMEKAVEKMTRARGEYEKQRIAKGAREAKAKRLDGRWM